MKQGDLVKIAPRPFLGRVERIGILMESFPDDPMRFIYRDYGLSLKVFVMGQITCVGVEYLTVIKKVKVA